MKNETLRRIIEEQQRGHENEPLFTVGHQLLEIADKEPENAELLEKDLLTDGMKLADAAQKLQEYADNNHGGAKCFCITPTVAEKILREFYGLSAPLAKNKRCPLQAECEKSCAYENHELDCQYYNANGYGEAGIPDQEEIRKQLETRADEERYNAELDDTADDDDESPSSEDDTIQKLRKMVEDPDAFVYTEEVTGKIVNIPIELLHHHHDNPRKDLGDLSELSESIKAKGILQNLTVVPFWFKISGCGEDRPEEQAKLGYLVVIGNRRLEAAKMVGLKSLPCIIASMTQAEQVQTMLMENMQRADLTPYEQAQGFQMMLDFGDTIDGISEKTGFSKASVRRRLKMAELDQKTLKNVSSRQFTLYEIDRVCQIEDENTRNHVLAEIGTKNFENAISKAIEAQKGKKKKEDWEKIFKEKGLTEIPYPEIWGGNYSIPAKLPYINGEPDAKQLDENLEPGIQYYYAWGYNGTPYIRMDKVENEETIKAAAEKQRKEAEERERRQQLSDISTRAFKLRFEFIRDYAFRDCKNHLKEINEWTQIREIVGFISETWFSGYATANFGRKNYFDLFGLTKEAREEKAEYSMIAEFVEKHAEKALLYHAYSLWCDSEDETCYDWGYHFKENKKLKMIYHGLHALGYELSDEEEEMLNGTCSLLVRQDGNAAPIDCDASEDDDSDDEIDDEDFDQALSEKLGELTEDLSNK